MLRNGLHLSSSCNDDPFGLPSELQDFISEGAFFFPCLINTHYFLNSYTDFAMSGEVVVQDHPCAQG